MEKPDFYTDDHATYLENLRQSGATNMFGAVPYLMAAFPELNRRDASSILEYWMYSYEEPKR